MYPPNWFMHFAPDPQGLLKHSFRSTHCKDKIVNHPFAEWKRSGVHG